MTIGISGNFPDQVYEIPQGGSVRGLDTKIVVFNGNPEDITVTMVDDAPPGVTIDLSPREFVIPAASGQMPTYQEVAVGVRVSADAPPMAYTITVTAQPSRVVQGGVVPLPAANVSAPLMVLGESATVVVDTVSPREEPVVSDIRLFRIVGSDRYEYNYSQTGHLQAVVSPGRYEALAYVGGVELARDGFDVPVNQEVRRMLVVETIYFRSFQVLPATNTRTGELGWVQVIYTLTNVYQAVSDAEVRLVVGFNGEPLQQLQILFLGVLEKGDIGVPYQYSPPGGWERGTYGFKLELYVGEQLYAQTNEQTLDVGGGAKGSWLWIIFVVLGVLAAIGLGFLIFLLVKRRKEEGEQPRKKDKKRKEEKPARKAVPYRPPEPVRRPEPVQPPPPLEPVMYEEPPVEPPVETTVEPAPLASVSSLKARMASLGRDQGPGKPAVEEPDSGKVEEAVETTPLASQQAEERPPAPRGEDRGESPPAGGKPPAQKPGIYSSVTATPKQDPPRPPGGIQINWPPKPPEPPEAPSAPAEPALPEVEAVPPPAPEEAVPAGESAPMEPPEPQSPPPRSSFAEAARLRMEARRRAAGKDKPGAAPGEPPSQGDGSGESGEGE